MPAQLAVRDLVKRYGAVEAAAGVSFEVAEGEVFGLLGKNGAGKTTTLECVLGLRRPDSGSIEIGGIDALVEAKRVKRLIGAQLQSTALQDQITPREALRFFASFYERSARPEDLIERFGLADKADERFETLSGGQRQRLGVALAFVNEPKLVVLDEPTAGLDAQSRRELHSMIAQMRGGGRTVVVTTHYIEEAHQLCDRIAIIDRGKIVAIGKPDELIAAAKTLPRVTVRTARLLREEQVRGIMGVVNCRRDGEAWVLTSEDVNKTVVALVGLLEADGNELRDVQIRRASLEDVFVQLTGMEIANWRTGHFVITVEEPSPLPSP
jgi:ABC-2 type transport system ATP-binding protein